MKVKKSKLGNRNVLPRVGKKKNKIWKLSSKKAESEKTLKISNLISNVRKKPDVLPEIQHEKNEKMKNGNRKDQKNGEA